MSTAITSSRLTDVAFSLVSANRDFGLGAAMPATSPPTMAPATSTAATETHQRMATLPSFHENGATQNVPRKAETRDCRSRSQESNKDHFWLEPRCSLAIRRVRRIVKKFATSDVGASDQSRQAART